MKRNARFYRVHVDDQGQRASHIAITYNLHPHDEVTFFEFYRLVYDSSMGASLNSIPPGKELSFREELRVMDYSVHAESVLSDEYNDVIERKMKEAYGKNTEVQIEIIISENE
ncbi:hypothetical protein [Natronogracilivirga saccharolytica]|uniref:Uncharacterized protein n=1 Tax=Natronogracilivirga saccharolytica TaxID=2812953 RepID=A0A8J7UUT5_9BACT|nr:hypothetical protein [Natronogracilivirga saccharolytica]MBP3192725.1 hypothetical protein [Natronogracilivirga saccharolytica]